MTKIKKWICCQYLPLLARESMEAEIDRLKIEIADRDTHIKELNAYICGLEFAIRKQQRITLGGGGK